MNCLSSRLHTSWTGAPEMWLCWYFWSAVNICGTHWISFSYVQNITKIDCTVPHDTATSCHTAYSQSSVLIISCTLLKFSWLVTSGATWMWEITLIPAQFQLTPFLHSGIWSSRFNYSIHKIVTNLFNFEILHHCPLFRGFHFLKFLNHSYSMACEWKK